MGSFAVWFVIHILLEHGGSRIMPESIAPMR